MLRLRLREFYVPTVSGVFVTLHDVGATVVTLHDVGASLYDVGAIVATFHDVVDARSRVIALFYSFTLWIIFYSLELTFR